MSGTPQVFWMNETSGVLKTAVEAYLNHRPMTPEHIAALRAYLRQWIAADWRGPELTDLRARIDELTSREALRHWLLDALEEGIDPL